MKKVPYTLSENSLTIFWEGKPYTLRKDHVNFKLAKQAIFEARYEDLGDLLDIAKAVEDFVEGEIEVKDEVVYYKNHRLHGVVVDKLLEMLRAGMTDSAPLTNFITRLQSNPSANSVNELYSFLSYKSLPTTPEGKVLGYKGVKDDFYSSTGNADTIVVQGKTNESHQILNEVGATIEVSRRCVDDNKDNHCSFGLHVGSYDYANGWAGETGRLLVVEFDPEDAVSVPTDCDFQKLRVSKYKVVEDITSTRKEYDKPVYEANKPIYDSDDDSDWGDEDEGRDYLYDDDGMDDDDMDQTDSDDNWEKVDEQELTEEEEEFNNLPENQMLNLTIRNYVENKLEKGERVTINHVNSLMACRDYGLRCAHVLVRLEDMCFIIEDNPDKAMSSLEIVGQKHPF
jgi:hypothetical protein